MHVIGNYGGISVHNPVLKDDIEFPKMIQTSLYISGSQAFPYGASEWGQLFLESTQVYEQTGVPFAWKEIYSQIHTICWLQPLTIEVNAESLIQAMAFLRMSELPAREPREHQQQL